MELHRHSLHWQMFVSSIKLRVELFLKLDSTCISNTLQGSRRSRESCFALLGFCFSFSAKGPKQKPLHMCQDNNVPPSRSQCSQSQSQFQSQPQSQTHCPFPAAATGSALSFNLSWPTGAQNFQLNLGQLFLSFSHCCSSSKQCHIFSPFIRAQTMAKRSTLVGH